MSCHIQVTVLHMRTCHTIRSWRTPSVASPWPSWCLSSDISTLMLPNKNMGRHTFNWLARCPLQVYWLLTLMWLECIRCRICFHIKASFPEREPVSSMQESFSDPTVKDYSAANKTALGSLIFTHLTLTGPCRTLCYKTLPGRANWSVVMIRHIGRKICSWKVHKVTLIEQSAPQELWLHIEGISVSFPFIPPLVDIAEATLHVQHFQHVAYYILHITYIQHTIQTSQDAISRSFSRDATIEDVLWQHKRSWRLPAIAKIQTFNFIQTLPRKCFGHRT